MTRTRPEQLAEEYCNKVYEEACGFPSDKEHDVWVARKAYLTGHRAAIEMAAELFIDRTMKPDPTDIRVRKAIRALLTLPAVDKEEK